MKTAIYPGTFDPWHEGHQDVLNKALEIFDNIIVLVGTNPDKGQRSYPIPKFIDNVRSEEFDGLLVDWIHSVNMPIHAIIRGLRNGKDLEDERSQQFWNEDLAKESGYYLPPTCYFVTDRSLIHISSSAHRVVNKLKRGRR